jgi:hypothetical protein
MIRWLLAIGVLLILATLVAGEIFARPLAEKAVAREVQQRYQLDREPKIHLEGFPFLVRVALGRLPAATGELQGTTVQGLRLEDAQLHLTDVRFDPGRLAGGNGQVRAQHGSASVTVSDADLTRLVQSQGVDLQITFQDGKTSVRGRLSIDGRDVDVDASGQLGLSDKQLHFQPDRLSAVGVDVPASLLDQYRDRLGFSVSVPTVAGVQLTQLTVETGRARLAADLASYVLTG